MQIICYPQFRISNQKFPSMERFIFLLNVSLLPFFVSLLFMLLSGAVGRLDNGNGQELYHYDIQMNVKVQLQ